MVVLVLSWVRRSSTAAFDFKNNCLFCGDTCNVKKDAKHPDRWRKAILCRTVETFKDAILEVSQAVKLRVDGALPDPHAAEACYHNDCRIKCMLPTAVLQVDTPCDKEVVDEAYERVVNVLKSDNVRTSWNTTELYKLYIENNGLLISRRELLTNLKDTFADEITISSSPGIASIVMFSRHAKSILRIDKDDDADETDILIKTTCKIYKIRN